jgi:hypothetical protein
MMTSPARQIPATASRLSIAAAALALALAGCSSVDGLFSSAPGVELAVLEPSAKAPEPEQLAVVRERRQVLSIERLEFGAIHKGRMMTAWGYAPESDWFSPQLEIRREGLPGPDGFIEFDLVAAPPTLNGGKAGAVGTLAQRKVRADIPLLNALTAGAAGIRVHAQDGAIAQRF